MRRLFLEFTAAIGLTLAATLALATGVSASDVIVKNAFARASASPAATTGAVYLTVTSPADDRLVSVFTPVAAMAHLHETHMEGDVAKMDMLDTLKLAAGTETQLKPGGIHIMLMGLKAPLKEGDTLPLELTFEKAGTIAVMVTVGGVAAQAAGSSGG